MRLRPFFPRCEPAGPGRSRPGFSLVELLVVLVLMVVVTAAAFTLFQIGARHEARQQDVLNQAQNLRTALHALARDVRMAGNGLNFIGARRLDIYVDPALFDANTQREPGWFRYRDAEEYGVRAIYGTNGECNGGSAPICPPPPGADICAPDTLTVFRAEIENPLALGHLGATFTPGTDSTFSIKEAVTLGENIADGDILAVAAGTRAVVVQARLSGSGSSNVIAVGPRFNPGATLPGGFSFPEGSMIYNLRNIVFVTYYIDRGPNHNRLMANYHDGTLTTEVTDIEGVANTHLLAVAGNIEDLQVAYFLAKLGTEGPLLDTDGVIEALTPDIDEAVLDNDGGQFVRVVSLALTSRSSRVRDGGSGTGATADQYTCMGLNQHVTLRNNF